MAECSSLEGMVRRLERSQRHLQESVFACVAPKKVGGPSFGTGQRNDYSKIVKHPARICQYKSEGYRRRTEGSIHPYRVPQLLISVKRSGLANRHPLHLLRTSRKSCPRSECTKRRANLTCRTRSSSLLRLRGIVLPL